MVVEQMRGRRVKFGFLWDTHWNQIWQAGKSFKTFLWFYLKLEAKMDFNPFTIALNEVLHYCKILPYSQILDKDEPMLKTP
jgi:hypothetical protein